MQKEFVRRECDWCKTRSDYEKHGGMSEAQGEEMARWITLAREYMVQDQAYPVVKHACSDSCAKNIIETGMLALPQNVQEFVDAKKARGAN